jgi:hypothetical protein
VPPDMAQFLRNVSAEAVQPIQTKMHRARTINQDSIASRATKIFGSDRKLPARGAPRTSCDLNRNPRLECLGALDES